MILRHRDIDGLPACSIAVLVFVIISLSQPQVAVVETDSDNVNNSCRSVIVIGPTVIGEELSLIHI